MGIFEFSAFKFDKLCAYITKIVVIYIHHKYAMFEEQSYYNDIFITRWNMRAVTFENDIFDAPIRARTFQNDVTEKVTVVI